MFQEEYNSIINDPGNIMDIALADVRGISERYPYCQAAQVIYAKKPHELRVSQDFRNPLLTLTSHLGPTDCVNCNRVPI